jgi:TolB protein
MRTRLLLALVITLAAAAPASGAELLGHGSDGLWLVSDDGRERSALANRYAVEATWSGDGERLVVSAFDGERWRLLVGPPTGPLTMIPGTERIQDPAVSPDGTQIAGTRPDASRSGNAQTQIVVLPFAGGTPRAVTSGADDTDPVWSPDGTRIAFTRTPDAAPDDEIGGPPAPVMTVSLDGTDLRTVTSDGANPSWSADGSRIAFATDRDRNGETCENEGTEEAFCRPNHEIYSVGADGADEQRLTRTTADETTPAFSPDGARIAFAADRHWKDTELWVMDADGTCATQITFGAGFVYEPVWRPGRPQVVRGACGVLAAPFTAKFDFPTDAREPKADPLVPPIPYGGMHPVRVGRGYLDLDECGLARRGDCAGRITVSAYTTCARNPAKSLVPVKAVEGHRGALVLFYFYRALVISGGTTTEIYADKGTRPFLRRIVRSLRPLSRAGSRPARLARPQLPASAWSRLLASERVRRDGRAKKAALVRSDRLVLGGLRTLRAGRRPACVR